MYTVIEYRHTAQHQKITDENVFAASKSQLPQLKRRCGYQLLQLQPKTGLVVALSDLMCMSGRHIGLSEANSPTQKVNLEAKSLTWHNQEVLIGVVYRLD